MIESPDARTERGACTGTTPAEPGGGSDRRGPVRNPGFTPAQIQQPGGLHRRVLEDHLDAGAVGTGAGGSFGHGDPGRREQVGEDRGKFGRSLATVLNSPRQRLRCASVVANLYEAAEGPVS